MNGESESSRIFGGVSRDGNGNYVWLVCVLMYAGYLRILVGVYIVHCIVVGCEEFCRSMYTVGKMK